MGVGALSGPPAIETTPRRVPWGVRARVVIHPGTLIGGLVFGIAAAMALADDPLGHALLAFGARRAPGRPIAVEPTWWEHHGPIYRCRYSFRTPDGVARRGVSFVAARPGPMVVVEYSPARPGTSRIAGALPGLCPPLLAVVMGGVSLVGLSILAVSLLYGWGTLRLLRIGEVSRATLVACAFTTSWEKKSDGGTRTCDHFPFEQFRQVWLAGADYSPEARKHYRRWLQIWTWLMLVMGGLGLVGLVAVLGQALFGNAPVLVNRPMSKAAGIAFGAGFLVVWVLVTGLSYRFGRRAVAELSGPAVPARDKPPPLVSCTYDFELPDGRVIRASALVWLDECFGAGPPETVLYDPARPELALLVYSLRPGVRLSPLGAWESTGNWVPWLGLAAVATVVSAAFALFS